MLVNTNANFIQKSAIEHLKGDFPWRALSFQQLGL